MVAPLEHGREKVVSAKMWAAQAPFWVTTKEKFPMIKKILLAVVIIVVVVVGALAVIVALQPSYYRIERSANISAPAATVFAQVNDFHKWEAWSPWARID